MRLLIKKTRGEKSAEREVERLDYTHFTLNDTTGMLLPLTFFFLRMYDINHDSFSQRVTVLTHLCCSLDCKCYKNNI